MFHQKLIDRRSSSDSDSTVFRDKSNVLKVPVKKSVSIRNDSAIVAANFKTKIIKEKIMKNA
jgi:hypothetical protein